ncbi:hypothetical protein K469DRAFT_346109 [Zopfia rhizophila CBS 207.26]|uniref:Uncharacterized protein n=1 Tax=Zopfia rhizophila CBS 207.26 TaxID=1314779 RepID=A0A6A6EMN2_9PEZI|nr:hypothetical protein K469DRAFT_346109 [Zopfia rhizophila CBS 207.26]
MSAQQSYGRMGRIQAVARLDRVLRGIGTINAAERRQFIFTLAVPMNGMGLKQWDELMWVVKDILWVEDVLQVATNASGMKSWDSWVPIRWPTRRALARKLNRFWKCDFPAHAFTLANIHLRLSLTILQEGRGFEGSREQRISLFQVSHPSFFWNPSRLIYAILKAKRLFTGTLVST